MEQHLKHYPVVIVGAGPAGCAAAINFKKKNIPVLLIDKADFPRDKVCVDGIPLKTFKLLEELGFNEDELFKGGFKISRMIVYSPQNHKTIYGSLKSGSAVKSGCIPRKYFDNLLFQKAASMADEVLSGNKVIKISNDKNQRRLTLRRAKDGIEFEITAGLVIAADGANSIIARQTGLLQSGEERRFDGMRVYYKGKKFDSTVHIFYDKRTLPGYFWIFPVAEDTANVGIMINKKSANIRKLFQEVLDTNPGVKQILNGAQPASDVRGTPLTLGKMPGSRTADGVMLIGDAAAFINPVTGGGIYYAVLSAKKAAEFGSIALAEGNVLKENLALYEKWRRREIIPGFKYSNMLKRRLSSERSAEWLLKRMSKNKLFANFFIMVYGRPLPKYTFLNPLFWVKVFLSR